MHKKIVIELTGAAETLFAAAVESSIDIVNEIVSDPGSRAPWSYRMCGAIHESTVPNHGKNMCDGILFQFLQ